MTKRLPPQTGDLGPGSAAKKYEPRMHPNRDEAVIRVHSCPFVALTIFFRSPEDRSSVNREPGSGVGLRGMPDGVVLFSWLLRIRSGSGLFLFAVSLLSFLFPVSKKSWSAPPPDKPSGQGLFGLPEGTGAAPMTGAPAAHCLCIHRDQRWDEKAGLRAGLAISWPNRKRTRGAKRRPA
jgi:hypothetical protein